MKIGYRQSKKRTAESSVHSARMILLS